MARTNGKPNLTPEVRARIAQELTEGASVASTMRRYGITETCVYHIMRKHNIKRRRWRKWTAEEDALIREHYPAHGALWDGWARLMPERKPTKDDIHNRAHRLGVRRREI